MIGRKRLLLISYVVFSLAAMVCGLAPHFSVFVVGRALAGVGGSGMIAMVNLIVSDLVGLKELAGYRGWFQAAMATGRLCGGPVGGFFMERVGWRVVFVAQMPISILAAGACAVLIPSKAPTLGSDGDAADGAQEAKSGTVHCRDVIWLLVQKVDIGGSSLLVCTITMGLISLNLLGDGYTFHDIQASGTLGLCLMCGGLLFAVERYLVAKPMLSRRLLSDDIVVGVYAINILGMIAQSSLTFILPLEQRILNSSTADRTGLQLLPLVAGSIGGSIAAGILIKRFVLILNSRLQVFRC
ncbi:MFS-type transporter ucsD [Fulvia fulva]|uniref:MFS-type transporter ucsD n=1 Tax=Passalora fulva TaxID=5499 RepID=A0A9Q8LDH7_PASFU|nr:MFS-type transporter ucsD [Fulvia fulva]UJO15379.1 MFS-type transporter ucsD [Fulvia fulva]WPV12579.1 MFS-type transporter ucsD [Fulvia fulva]